MERIPSVDNKYGDVLKQDRGFNENNYRAIHDGLHLRELAKTDVSITGVWGTWVP